MAEAKIQKLSNVVRGEVPSLLDAEKANELINAINAFRTMTISPQGFGKLTLGKDNVVLDLNSLKKLIDELSTTVSAFSQANGGGGAGGSGGGTSSSVTNTINAIINGLQGMTLTLACDPATRQITGTINLTLPPLL